MKITKESKQCIQSSDGMWCATHQRNGYPCRDNESMGITKKGDKWIFQSVMDDAESKSTWGHDVPTKEPKQEGFDEKLEALLRLMPDGGEPMLRQLISEEIQRAEQRVRDVYEEAIGVHEEFVGDLKEDFDAIKRNDFRTEIRERVEKKV